MIASRRRSVELRRAHGQMDVGGRRRASRRVSLRVEAPELSSAVGVALCQHELHVTRERSNREKAEERRQPQARKWGIRIDPAGNPTVQGLGERANAQLSKQLVSDRVR